MIKEGLGRKPPHYPISKFPYDDFKSRKSFFLIMELVKNAQNFEKSKVCRVGTSEYEISTKE